jgi:hypothetical protein
MTEQEIATRRRLRLACEFLGKLAANEMTTHAILAASNETHATLSPTELSEETIAALRDYESTHLQPGDLLAIRNRPGQWCLTNPYDWLWVLHRYQNKYQYQT